MNILVSVLLVTSLLGSRSEQAFPTTHTNVIAALVDITYPCMKGIVDQSESHLRINTHQQGEHKDLPS